MNHEQDASNYPVVQNCRGWGVVTTTLVVSTRDSEDALGPRAWLSSDVQKVYLVCRQSGANVQPY